MAENKTASSEGIHYVQAAQRLGITVQQLMQMERSGRIDPPASLDAGRGRVYTEAELNRIIDSLAASSGKSPGFGNRTWLAVGGLALVIGLIFLFGRPSKSPVLTEDEETVESSVAERKEKAPRERDQASSEGGLSAEAEPVERLQRPPRVQLEPEEQAQLEETRAANRDRVKAQQSKGIYY